MTSLGHLGMFCVVMVASSCRWRDSFARRCQASNQLSSTPKDPRHEQRFSAGHLQTSLLPVHHLWGCKRVETLSSIASHLDIVACGATSCKKKSVLFQGKGEEKNPNREIDMEHHARRIKLWTYEWKTSPSWCKDARKNQKINSDWKSKTTSDSDWWLRKKLGQKNRKGSAKKTLRNVRGEEKWKPATIFLHCILIASIFKNVKKQQMAALGAWCLATSQPSKPNAICSILCLHFCQRFLWRRCQGDW